MGQTYQISVGASEIDRSSGLFLHVDRAGQEIMLINFNCLCLSQATVQALANKT